MRGRSQPLIQSMAMNSLVDRIRARRRHCRRHRPRICRATARRRVRASGITRHGFRRGRIEGPIDQWLDAATFRMFRPKISPRPSALAGYGATTNMAELAQMDVIDICVPTPLRKTRDPDLSYVVKAVEAVAAAIRRGQLVILESTTYPGTTDEVVRPMLEEGGLRADVDFLLAFSPERVDPGNPTFNTRTIPKSGRRGRRRQHRGGIGALRVGGRARWSRSRRRVSPKW